MAKRTVTKTKPNVKKTYDSSQLSARQQVKLAKLNYKTKTQQTRMKTAAVRSVAANVANAVTSTAGTIIAGKQAEEQTKRFGMTTAANQATQGGLSESTNERDEDKKDKSETNPWVY